MKYSVESFSHIDSNLNYWNCICLCGESVVLNQKQLNGHFKGCPKCIPEGGIIPPYIHVYHRYIKSAEKRNIPFELEIGWFKKFIENSCIYCGIDSSLIFKSKHVIYKYNGIDRLDNNEGYYASNCYTCCNLCNRAKNNLTIEEFNSWINRIKNYR